MSYYMPYVIEKNYDGERSYDIYSRLLKDRIVFIGSEINDVVANSVIAQLLFLESENTNDISMYINSPGGVVTSGLAIIDTMNYIKSPVNTICIGLAASMGAMILTCGERGKRFALPNAEIMIHQPLGGAQGQASDIEIRAKNIIKTKEKLNRMISNTTGKDYEKVCNDTDRDNFMSAEEALEYGLIDQIISNKN